MNDVGYITKVQKELYYYLNLPFANKHVSFLCFSDKIEHVKSEIGRTSERLDNKKEANGKGHCLKLLQKCFLLNILYKGKTPDIILYIKYFMVSQFGLFLVLSYFCFLMRRSLIAVRNKYCKKQAITSAINVKKKTRGLQSSPL